jgi:hypothetical protein
MVRGFLVGVAALALLLGMALTGSPAVAQTRPSPAATQHALDELANAIAQGRVTLTATPSATATASPTTTPRPTVISPTDTPEPATPTPAPPQLVSGVGGAVAAYVRPSPNDSGGTGVELAVLYGRWEIQYDTALCTPPAPWTNVWLALDEQSNRPITVERDDTSAMCAVAQWSWISDAPCAADDQGSCEVALDNGYLDALAQVEPTDTEVPVATPVPLATAAAPTPRPVLPPVVPPPPVVEPPPPEVRVQTVVVLVTAVPTVTQVPTHTAVATSTPVPTSTVTPTSLPKAVEPTPTEVPVVVAAEVSATEPPAFVDLSNAPAQPQTAWNWPLTFLLLALVLGLLAIWLFVARSGPLMW